MTKSFSSTNLLLTLALFIGTANCLSQIHFPSSSSSSSSSSISSSNSPSDHEESEQVQAFVIAEPQSAASESDESTVSASSSSSSANSADSMGNSIGQVDSGSSNPSSLSALPILINLALNNMAATMSHGPGGPTFRTSRDPCSGCGCKCSHGSQSILCQLCAQRGYKSSPCPCAGSASASSSAPVATSAAYMAPAASYYYPVYYDAVTGLPVSSAASNRMSYYRSPYYGSSAGRSMSMAASYVVPTYATVVPVAASSMVAPSTYSSYQPQAAASYLYPVTARPYGPSAYAASASSYVPTYVASPATTFARRSSWSSPYQAIPLASQFVPVRYYTPYVY